MMQHILLKGCVALDNSQKLTRALLESVVKGVHIYE